jgi:DNA polymerase I-like protein with 3'-5' exonuclease and polymerase domains/5'-3' exonuclease/intein/homing endonuclease
MASRDGWPARERCVRIHRMAPAQTERFFVLDGPGYLYRAYHALPPLTTARGLPIHVVFGMSTMLWKLLREEQPDYFAVAWDAPGPTFRDERFAGYKESRPAMPDDLRSQIALVMTLFEALRLPVLQAPGFEADDVLATLVERTEGQPIEMVLVTNDKDILQLVSPRVTVHSPGLRGLEKAVYDEAGVRAKWGVDPGQIPDMLALMGDSIDDIPGVPGVGAKTAVKLISQFGSVERLYENLPLVAGKLRETLAAHRKEAFLSRELATVSPRAPVSQDLESLRRREPDWDRLRALWTELEMSTLLRQIPTQEIVTTAPEEEAPLLETPEALAEYLAAVPAGDAIAVDWVGDGGPPEPTITALGLFHPAAGPARVAVAGDRPLDLGGRTLIGHDVKALVERELARGAEAPAIEDTALAAYLINPARSQYRLEDVSADLLGEGPGLAPAGSRARFVWRLWERARPALEEAGLWSIYEDMERPLVPVLAMMERHGIRVDPARLIEFSKELERDLDRLTREIHSLAGEEFNLGSPKQLATILFEKLKLPPVRRTKTGYSTDADVLEQLALGHPLPAKIIEHRTLAKLKSTYADSLPTLINSRTGRIHTSFNQLVAATGRLSCLPACTLIATQRGLIGIEEVRVGDTVRTARGPRQVLAHERTGVKEVVALRLSTGLILRCSPDHRLRSRGQWKEASSIKPGDPLYMTFREGPFGTDVAINARQTAAYATRKTPRLPAEWSVELAELVGYAMADGHIARSNYNGKGAKLVLAFGWEDGELIDRFRRIIVELFGKEPTPRITRTCPVLEVSGVDICGLLEDLGAGGQSKVIQVPPSLLRAPRAIVAGFLRGYFEGDGSARGSLQVKSVSRDMLEGVHHLLGMFGIPATICDGAADPRGYAPRHTLMVVGDRSKRHYRNRIGFLSMRKRNDLDELLDRQSRKSPAEVLTLPDPDEVRSVRTLLYKAHWEQTGSAPQALYVFAHKFAAGRGTCTLPRAEEIVEIVRSQGAEPPEFLNEAAAGQYFEVKVESIHREPKVPMYDIAVEDAEYVADGIVVHNSSAPNLQNIPIRTGLGRRIRAAFIPEPGWRFVAADYSQIELRILAHVSGEESLLEAFRRGEDIHRRTAAEVFGVAVDAVTAEHRDIAKTTNFSVIYGVTAFGLSRGLSISQKEARAFLDRFFAQHPRVAAYLEATVAGGRERGWVSTLLGRRRYLPELRSGNPNLRGFAERMATNAPIQGTAADLIKIAMVRMARALAAAGLRSRMLLQVHDELLFEAPEDEVLALEALAREVMESAMTLSVPLKVDIASGTDWAQV